MEYSVIPRCVATLVEGSIADAVASIFAGRVVRETTIYAKGEIVARVHEDCSVSGAVEVDQNWVDESTIYTFLDGSKLLVTGSEASVLS